MAAEKFQTGKVKETDVNQFLDVMLKDNGGLLLGEAHSSRSQFKVLVDYVHHAGEQSPVLLMEYFKEEQQQELDDFFTSKDDLETGHWDLYKYFLGRSVMNHAMVEEGMPISHENAKSFLESFDEYMEYIYTTGKSVDEAAKEGDYSSKEKDAYKLIERLVKKEKEEPYNLLQLLETCKAYGARVVAVDSDAARYVKTLDERHEALNKNIEGHIKTVLSEKKDFIVCVGKKHTRDHEREDGKGTVKGIQTVTGLPDVFVTDHTDKKQMRIEKSSKAFSYRQLEVYGDYVLTVPEALTHQAYHTSFRQQVAAKDSSQEQGKDSGGCCIIS